MSLSITSRVTLNSGIEIPYLGLGVYMSSAGEETENAVRYAIDAGYRHIDTAKLYANEKDIGKAIRDCGIPREEIFITTKLWNTDHGYKSALTACDRSLANLDTYIDLYLIHWPVEELRMDSWSALERLVTEGKCKAIGVSNYTIRHIEELLKNCKVPPAVNQVEFSPFLYQRELLEFCRNNNIRLEAYSPLTRGKKLNDPTLEKIAAKYNKSTAQILIRWALQHDIIVLPKSIQQNRIVENSSIYDFTIDQEDMITLNNLNENFRTCWDPTDVK